MLISICKERALSTLLPHCPTQQVVHLRPIGSMLDARMQFAGERVNTIDRPVHGTAGQEMPDQAACLYW